MSVVTDHLCGCWHWSCMGPFNCVDTREAAQLTATCCAQQTHRCEVSWGGVSQRPKVWSSLCLDFFKGTAKADVQAVLAVFDGGTPNEGEDVARLLRETGLVSANGAPVRFSPERHLAYVQARNAARSEAHRQLGVARRLHLAHAIQSTVPFESEGEQSRFVTRRRLHVSHHHLPTFVLGVSPLCNTGRGGGEANRR